VVAVRQPPDPVSSLARCDLKTSPGVVHQESGEDRISEERWFGIFCDLYVPPATLSHSEYGLALLRLFLFCNERE
jgi:hypothetical protein